ncbi:MAG: GNAT family N-acetyltransferase [Erysipelotrichaceae bacterium]|nr:GNAT family N-acetyltransferase [Erysipelotrichaceae bacterium]
MEYTFEENAIKLGENGETLAELDFTVSEDVYNITRVYVSEELRGQGVGSLLMRKMIEEVESRQGKLAATCPYAIRWLEEHKDNEIREYRFDRQQPFYKPEIIRGIQYKRILSGKRLHFDFICPKQYYGDSFERFPLIIYTKGSGWHLQNRNDIPLLVSRYVQLGFCVAIVEYSAIEDGATFPDQIIDANDCLRYLFKHKDKFPFDEDFLIAAGDSSGAHTAIMQALTAGDPAYGSWEGVKFRGVIDYYAPVDLTKMLKDETFDDFNPFQTTKVFLSGFDAGKVYEHVPMHHLDDDAPPFLVLHGTEDEMVPYEQSVLLVRELKKRGVRTTFVTVEGAAHADPAFWQDDVFATVREFLLSLK